jgi:hypothetical protein
VAFVYEQEPASFLAFLLSSQDFEARLRESMKPELGKAKQIPSSEVARKLLLSPDPDHLRVCIEYRNGAYSSQVVLPNS